MDLARMERRERISLRNQVESSSDHFDWHNFARYYAQAHELALKRAGG